MTSSALLFIHAQTSLHPGTGTALGTVDLPIQRERHTGWPTIAGSSLKGVLRDACREKIAIELPKEDSEVLDNGESRKWSRRKRADHEHAELTAVFGPPADDADKHAGSLSITDARILAFPVRSLKGVFAWVTCPAVLQRLARDVQLAGEEPPLGIPGHVAPEKARCGKGCPLRVDGDKLVLEEFDFICENDGGEVPKWLARNAVADSFTRDRIESCFVILPDDAFTHFVRHGTEVVARIALNYETKTVAGTALFYQEFLPTETLLYALVFASDSRRNGHSYTAAQLLKFVHDCLPPALQIGGDETTGKGLCSVRMTRREEGGR